jgi:hypothetical protein
VWKEESIPITNEENKFLIYNKYKKKWKKKKKNGKKWKKNGGKKKTDEKKDTGEVCVWARSSGREDEIKRKFETERNMENLETWTRKWNNQLKLSEENCHTRLHSLSSN